MSNSPIPAQAYGSNATFNDANGRPVTNNFYRQGGNRMTGYNWENNASNAGADYGPNHEDWFDVPSGVTPPGMPATTITTFVNANKTKGADSLITLQMAGYVSVDGNCNCNVSVTGAADSSGTYWKGVYFVKGSAFADPPITSDNSVYMDELLNYLGVHLGL